MYNSDNETVASGFAFPCSTAETFSLAETFNPLTDVQEKPAAKISKFVGSSHPSSGWLTHFLSGRWICVMSCSGQGKVCQQINAIQIPLMLVECMNLH